MVSLCYYLIILGEPQAGIASNTVTLEGISKDIFDFIIFHSRMFFFRWWYFDWTWFYKYRFSFIRRWLRRHSRWHFSCNFIVCFLIILSNFRRFFVTTTYAIAKRKFTRYLWPTMSKRCGSNSINLRTF